MSLPNYSFCRYWKEPKNESQWTARAIVRAVKGDAFNGYADLTIAGRSQRLTELNPDLAVEWFVERFIETFGASQSNYSLVPFPGRKCLVADGQLPKTVKLAAALEKQSSKFKVWDTLRFAKEMPEKCRVEQILYQELRLIRGIPQEGIIILDDVCTTGAHARAAARFFREKEGAVIAAVSVARTALEPDEEPFGVRRDELNS